MILRIIIIILTTLSPGNLFENTYNTKLAFLAVGTKGWKGKQADSLTLRLIINVTIYVYGIVK